MSSDEELLTFQRFLLAFDTPAYLRRARQVEGEWRHLLACLGRERERRLELPRLRLAQLFAAGDVPLTQVISSEDADQLRTLYREWQPVLRAEPASAGKTALELVRQLVEAFERFNRHWDEYLTGIDLRPVNQLRDGYNRYYVLEKECAVRSAQTAREGFEPLPMATVNDLRSEFPPLPVPALLHR